MVDPWDRRGVRHDLPSILCLAVTGILAGCESLMAIWEHATDLEADDLRSLVLEAGRALPWACSMVCVSPDGRTDADDCD